MMVAAILLATAMAAQPVRQGEVRRFTAIARARIISAPRLDLRTPPKRMAGAKRGRRTIDFE